MLRKVKIASITVPDKRHRKTFDNIAELAVSIEKIGLIEPIVIDEDGTLIAGERRLRAYQMLGLSEIDAILKSDLDEWTKRTMELEENIRRENLTWQEQVDATLALHELYQEKFGKSEERHRGGWGVEKTAELLGVSVGCVSEDLELAKALREDDTLDKYEGKKVAFKVMKARKETDFRKDLAKILAGDVPASEERTRLILGDSRAVLKGYEDGSFDFCVTDPPYAVDLDELVKRWRGGVWVEKTYQDAEGEFSLHREVFTEVFRVLKEGAHCYVFFASRMYTEVCELLIEVGFAVRKSPIIWVKSLTEGRSNNPFTEYGQAYESIFYCVKGTPKKFVKPGRVDVVMCEPPTVRIHPTERPAKVLDWLIENCSVEDEIGVDPFGGSASFLVSCERLGRRGVAIEVNEDYYVEALKRLKGGE